MGGSETSQAAAVSALLRKKADVMPRPSGASNSREYAVIVRRGMSVAEGASIAVGADDWTPGELAAVARRIQDALTGADYSFARDDLRNDRMVYFRQVKKAVVLAADKGGGELDLSAAERAMVYKLRKMEPINSQRAHEIARALLEVALPKIEQAQRKTAF